MLIVRLKTPRRKAHRRLPRIGTVCRRSARTAPTLPRRCDFYGHRVFSAKYTDGETGLLYYGYRYYEPSTGTWASQDPIGERGGLNLLAFVANDPVAFVDLFGFGANDLMGFDGLPLAPHDGVWPISRNPYTDRLLPTAQQIRLWIRISGVAQCIGGAFESVGGAVIATGGAAGTGGSGGAASPATVPMIVAGGYLFVNGADNMATGFTKIWTGVDARTLTEQGIGSMLRQAGMSSPQANMWASSLNNASMMAGGMASTFANSGRVTVTITAEEVSSPAVVATEVPAATPVGRLGSPLSTVARNTPATIEGRVFTGHALDQMQARGVTPTIVDNAIRSGARSAGNTTAEMVYYDAVNNITVVTDISSGRVITVFGGAR